MAAVSICSDFEAQNSKVCYYFHCFPIACREVMGPDAMTLVFWMLRFKPAFPLSSFTFIKKLCSSPLFSVCDWTRKGDVRKETKAGERSWGQVTASLGQLGLHPLDNWGTLKFSKWDREGDLVIRMFWKCHSGSCVVFGTHMVKTKGKMRTLLWLYLPLGTIHGVHLLRYTESYTLRFKKGP